MPSRDFDRRVDTPGRVPSTAPLAIPPTDWYRSLAAAGLRDNTVHGPARFWLQAEGSLTRDLQRRCTDSFHVNVIREGFSRPTHEEAQTLHVPERQLAWIREVQLCGDGAPWVLARTIIPLATLEGAGRRLRHLGRQPLGAWLFSNPRWRRGPFETGVCVTRHPSQPPVARRSRFHNGDKALLVGEYFLPRFCH